MVNSILADLAFYRIQRKKILAKAFLSAVSNTPSSKPKDTVSVKNRNNHAEQILNRYGNAILRFSYTYVHNMVDAEDILQEVLIRWLQTSPTFINQAHEKAWFMKVTANLSKNKLQYNAIRYADELDDTLACQEEDSLQELWDAVKSLDAPYRETIHLHYHDGYSVKEISRILGRKEATIRSDLHRGRMKLKEILKEDYDFE